MTKQRRSWSGKPLELEDAGAFAIVLEAIPDAVAETVTSRLKIPTIGIGAGPHCDGQVLVSYDMLGLFDTFLAPFVKQYAQLGASILNAATHHAKDVRQGVYPQARPARRDRASVTSFAESNAGAAAARRDDRLSSPSVCDRSVPRRSNPPTTTED